MDNGAACQEELPNNGFPGLENDGDPTPNTTKKSTFHSNLSLSGSSKRQDVNLNPVLSKYRHSSVITRGSKTRIVQKNGVGNLTKEKVLKRGQRFLRDIFTTMASIKWRYILLAFLLSYLLSWLGFASIWWLIAKLHGDLGTNHIEDNTWIPCVMNLRSFASAFLFSIETQHTIGYGYRYPTEECPESIFVMYLQAIIGDMIECLMAGFVIANICKPGKRSQTLPFSKNAIVCLRDGKMCLMFRVGNVRKSHFICAQISAQLIQRKLTLEGEVIPYYHTLLNVRCDEGGDRLFLIWPVTVVHTIDSSSPFFDMNAEDMLRENYELVVILEGTTESTGQSVQVRSSYTPSEILWGRRFKQVVSYKVTGEYLIDYSRFNATYEVETPQCSAKDYYSHVKTMSMSYRTTSFTENTH